MSLKEKLIKLSGSSNHQETDHDQLSSPNRQIQKKFWLFGVFDGHGGSKCA